MRGACRGVRWPTVSRASMGVRVVTLCSLSDAFSCFAVPLRRHDAFGETYRGAANVYAAFFLAVRLRASSSSPLRRMMSAYILSAGESSTPNAVMVSLNASIVSAINESKSG